jgi:predicted amidohydrolase
MQDLTVAFLQFDQVWQDKRANYARIEAYFQDSPSIDLVLLPEMFHTGFSMHVGLADDWLESEGLDFLKTLARQHDFSIYTSLMVQEGDKYANRGVFIAPNGKVHTYDKRKSFGLGGEDQYFTSGAQEKIVEFNGWKINLQICYDLRFPELVRNRITRGAEAYDLLLYVANWPQKRIAHWDALLKARAIENQCYVVACNRVGNDGNGLVYNGHSQAIDFFGKYLNGPHEHEGLFVVELSKDGLAEGRKILPFLKDA